jgi:DNA-binding NarL/FixJ family response regulator
MDLTMPGVAGVSLIDAVHGIAPKMPILILSMHDEPVTVRRALQAGASGYITKESTPDVLYTAITRVAAGERYIASNVAEQLAFEAVNQENIDAHRALSPREWEVLRLITEGLMLSQIADRLHLSPKTITTHKTHLMEKLGIDNNADLIRYAIENRLFE